MDEKNKKVFLFGIDGAPPELIFDKWLNDLPNIKRLIEQGTYAKMNSTIPPSTIVAWNAMISGKDTSDIGVYSYTKKKENGELRLVNSSDLKCKLLHDILGEKDKKSIMLYVPLSYPVKRINGCMVSGFLTPRVNDKCAYPDSIIKKLECLKNPDSFFDVTVGLAGHKELDVETLLKKTYEMTDMQIEILKDLIVNEEWDFFMSVMIGSDRLQHMLWRHFDETHKRFIEGSEHKDALKNYYIYLDKRLGEILELIDDNTVVIVASDHGMIKQEGKININNWLIEQGYLVLKEDIDLSEKKRFSTKFVDMEKTVAYGGGAYNARININKKNAGENYNKILNEITEKLKQIPDDKGNKLDTKVYKTEEIYGDNSDPECPDLMIYFDDLRWASNPDLGQEGLYSWKTAIGADSAGHSRQGCFIINGKGISKKGRIDDIDIQQVAPTILKIMNVSIPSDIKVNEIKINETEVE
jgi:predicted AlkP superfamily phosphohydrolase/phosphomutase